MLRIRMLVLAVVASITFAGAMSPVAMAQSTDTEASTPKQVPKAERKAARKANRTKKNAELSRLEKNGYNPADDQINYPQNIQDAEKKAAKAKASSTP
jgi:hypothetical protein